MGRKSDHGSLLVGRSDLYCGWSLSGPFTQIQVHFFHRKRIWRRGKWTAYNLGTMEVELFLQLHGVLLRHWYSNREAFRNKEWCESFMMEWML